MGESRSRIVCVGGMHRSGTSLATRLLNLLGVYLGPQDRLIPPRVGNPLGFWEHQKLTDLNDAILVRLGGTADEPPSFAADWGRDSKLDDLRLQARAIIREDFADAALWGWKDPRNSLTLPFWQALLPDMRYVVCVRNPLGVASSLEKRDGYPFAKSVDLWVTYTTGAIEHTAGKPRIFVLYENLLGDWQAELGRLAEFIESPVQPDDPQLQTQAQAFIQEELYHHRFTLREAVDAPDLPLTAKFLYFSLCALDQGPRSGCLGGVIGEQELAEALNILTTCIKEEQIAQQQKVALLTDLGALLAQKEVALAEKNAALAKTEAELRGLQARYDIATGSLGYRMVQRARHLINRVAPPRNRHGSPR